MAWPSIDSKTQLRLNVLRHRQKLLKLLENTNDTTLKPRIKFDPTDFDKLLGKPIKKEPIANDIQIKKEPVDEPYSSSDDISIGSNDGWNCTLPVVSEIDNRRRSTRLLSTSYDYLHPNNDSTKECMNASDLVEKTNHKCVKIPSNKRVNRRSSLPVGQRTRSRPRESFDRIKHNAKERECREELSRMFSFLKEYCSQLNTNRRVPSKQSILIAAKKECNELKYSENKLIAQKNKLLAINAALKKKLKEMRC